MFAFIEEGEAYALETFATTGTGSAHETGQHHIFSLNPARVPLRNQSARDIVRLVLREFKTLPFMNKGGFVGKELGAFFEVAVYRHFGAAPCVEAFRERG